MGESSRSQAATEARTQQGTETPLSRFIVASSHFAKEKWRVKPGALQPRPGDKLSVYRIDDLAESDVWELGRVQVSAPRGKPLYARGDFLVDCARECGLSVDFDNDPPRHVSIGDWPTQKSEMKLVAQELAAHATLVVNENP